MKTLILYATKHGAAHEIARRIASKINGAILHDLKQGGIPSLSDFDSVIIGSSVYAGAVRKEVKTFLSQNTGALRGKKLGLFLCGLDISKEEEYFNANFSPDILQAAEAKSFLGGIFNPKKAGFIERMIMKAVTKQSEYIDDIDDKRLALFAEVMRG
jgi:menaquinone-dependent protoporphyrinogen oxidase